MDSKKASGEGLSSDGDESKPIEPSRTKNDFDGWNNSRRWNEKRKKKEKEMEMEIEKESESEMKNS